jgi:hypothetical protein
MRPLALVLSQTIAFCALVLAFNPAMAGDLGTQPPERMTNASFGVPVQAVALSDPEMSGMRGAGLLDWLNALLGALPSQNTVQAQIGSSPPVTVTGNGPQTFTLTTSNLSVNLLADNSGTPPPVNVSQSLSSSTTRTFTRSFSLGF